MAILETVRKLSKSKKKALPSEKVNTPGRIQVIIDSIIKERRMLEVAVDERIQIFSSSCIIEKGTFRNSPCLVLDTLIPKLEGIRALEDASTLLIGFRLNEVPHTFESKFFFVGDENSPTVTISYPEVVYIHQFRGAYRLSPTLSEPIQVKVEMFKVKEKQGEALDAKVEPETVEKIVEEGNIVEDLSMEGMAFLTKNPKLTNGTEIFVDFWVPGVGNFETKAVVMNLGRTESVKYPFKCGVSFMDLTRADMDRIYRYILAKQREEIKKKQGTL